jgi:hypothetical protein
MRAAAILVAASAWFVSGPARAVDALVLTGHYDPEHTGALTLHTVKGDRVTESRILAEDDVFCSSFSPDGTRAAFVRWLPENRKRHRRGEHGMLVVDDIGGNEAEVSVVDLATGRIRKVGMFPTSWHTDYERLYWSSSEGDRWVYWKHTARKHPAVWRIDVETGRSEKIVEFNTWTAATGLSRDISPVSGRVLTRAPLPDRSRCVLYEMAQGDGDLTALKEHEHTTGLDLSPDGLFGAFVIGDSMFFVSFGAELSGMQDGSKVAERRRDGKQWPTKGFRRNDFLRPGDSDDSKQKMRGFGGVHFAANDPHWVLTVHWTHVRTKVEPGNWMDVVAYNPFRRKQIRITDNFTAAKKGEKEYALDVAHDMYVLTGPPPSPAKEAGAARAPEPEKRKPPRTASPAEIRKWDGRLLQSLKAAVERGSNVHVAYPALRTRLRVRSVGADGTMKCSGSGLEVDIRLSRLDAAGKAELAAELARGSTELAEVRSGRAGSGGAADHATAAFFFRLAGDEAEASHHLARAGDGAEEVRRAFGM